MDELQRQIDELRARCAELGSRMDKGTEGTVRLAAIVDVLHDDIQSTTVALEALGELFGRLVAKLAAEEADNG